MNGQVGATGAVGSEAGQLGESGLAEAKNSWTLWCWRTWQGSAVRHLKQAEETGQQGGIHWICLVLKSAEEFLSCTGQHTRDDLPPFHR